MPARADHLLARDVGPATGLAQDPRVDHDRPGAELGQAVADVLDLGALGIERPDQGDAQLRAHDAQAAGVPTVSTALRRRSIESWTYSS